MLSEGEQMIKEGDVLDPGAIGKGNFLIRPNPLSSIVLRHEFQGDFTRVE